METKILRIGSQILNAGDTGFAKGDRFGSQISQSFFADQVAAGNGYIATKTAAASITALGDTNSTLWNPANSDRLIIIEKVAIGSAAVNTAVMTAFQYGWQQTNTGVTQATDGPVKTFTHVDPINRLLGSQGVARCRWAPAVCSFTTAPALLAVVGFNLSATVSSFGNQIDYVNGGIMLMPGALLQVGASTATSTTFHVSIYFVEVDLDYTA